MREQRSSLMKSYKLFMDFLDFLDSARQVESFVQHVAALLISCFETVDLGEETFAEKPREPAD